MRGSNLAAGADAAVMPKVRNITATGTPGGKARAPSPLTPLPAGEGKTAPHTPSG